MVSAVDGCFGLVEGEVVFAKASIKIVKGSRHKVAVFGGKGQANIVDDGGAYGFRELPAVFHQNERQGDHKQEGTEGVALSHSLFQGVADGVVDAERGKRVDGEVYTGSVMIKEAEPRR